ncbi:MAG: carboxypeptidase regulatory-like domain-containing protein [Polyangiaceae bacterium]|nr:carboxypeptidase regulatory-like domain-containing protein [Polyangiaceae bacterium]
MTSPSTPRTAHLRLLRGAALLGPLLLPLLATGLPSCTPDAEEAPAAAKVTALRGVVTSSKGATLEGVKVSAGDVSTTTNAQGEYVLRVPAGKRTVHYAKAGFLDVQRQVDVLDGKLTMHHPSLVELAAPVPLDTTAGGSISGAGGVKLTAPANAFVDESGKPVTGMAELYLTPVPANDAATARSVSNFSITQNGAEGLLESFGMVDVQVKQGGKRLQVAKGKSVDLHIPALAAANKATDAPVWSFDEATGEWKQEAAVAPAAGDGYAISVPHFSLWNVDKPYTTGCISGRVVGKATGKPLAGADVEAAGVSYSGHTSTESLEGGRFKIFVKKASEVSLSVVHGFRGGVVKNVTSNDQDEPYARSVDPATLDTRHCVDIGDVTVIEDPWRDETPVTVDCSKGGPTLSGCAAEFSAAIQCGVPSGSCTTKVTQDGQASTTYANGVKIVVGSVDGKVSTTAYGPDGSKCYDAVMTQNAESGFSQAYTVPGKGVYTQIMSNDGYEFQCPSGETTKLTPVETKQLSACQAPGPQVDAGQCQIETPGSCTSKASCKANEECCRISGQLTMCTPAGTCASLDAGTLP